MYNWSCSCHNVILQNFNMINIEKLQKTYKGKYLGQVKHFNCKT